MYPDLSPSDLQKLSDFRDLQEVPDPKEQVFDDVIGPKDSSRNRQNWLREYHINIRFLSIGCVIEIGCKDIPFTSVDEAMKQLNAYIANPEAVSKEWLKILD